jgi:hypothetical protein
VEQKASATTHAQNSPSQAQTLSRLAVGTRAPHAVLVPDAPNGPAAFVERSIGGLEAICGPHGRWRWASTYEVLGLASLDLPLSRPLAPRSVSLSGTRKQHAADPPGRLAVIRSG